MNWLSALVGDGLSCITAASVAEAIAALEHNRIALTALDWCLDRCGAAVLQEANVNYPQVPVIVMSGRPYDVRTDALVGQADAFLEKPFNVTVFRSQVRQLLKRAERLAQALLPEAPEDIRPLCEIKEVYIRHAVRLLNNNVPLAADRLGIHRQTVGAVLKRARSLDACLWYPRPLASPLEPLPAAPVRAFGGRMLRGDGFRARSHFATPVC